MNIHGPNDFDAVYRVNGVQGDRSEDENNNARKRRKVRYKGRSWSEEEDLHLSPTLTEQKRPEESTSHRPAFYADSVHLKLAEALLKQMTTLEEKVAQLIFLKVEASYDPSAQNKVEGWIQNGQIGGLIFIKGDYKRQAYLIEHFQTLSKTPLLIGNDFKQGLYFYFQERSLPEIERVTQKRASDLGKAVMVQNRRLGVYLQLDQLLSGEEKEYQLAYEEKMAFRKGIRQANGIVGRQLNKELKDGKKKRSLPQFATVRPSGLAPVLTEQNIQEAIGLKTLDLIDLSQNDHLKDALEDALAHHHDAFVLENRSEEAIAILAQAVQKGIITEKEVEKRVLKILLIKSFTVVNSMTPQVD